MKIMAPAGNIECMNVAVKAGADEVYMGIAGFGARRFAKNFSVQEYCDAVGEAHRHGTAVNLTLNTIMADEELETLGESLEVLYATGVDAVIVQDLGFADFLKTHFPLWPRHASTQLSIAVPEEARWAERQGFTRLVLARELSLDEIANIRKSVSVELEVFASGALCIACSGKCFLSSFIGGRSGNRGMCTQPCRQKYRIVKPENLRATLNLPKNEGFLLSSRDQWQEFPEIAQLYALGVEVIKLEGRMKSPEYVFEAVRYYREMIDTLQSASPERLEQVLQRIRATQFRETKPTRSTSRPGIERLFNRGYSKGYMYEHDPDFINTAFSASWGVPCGKIVEGKNRRNGRGFRRIHLTQALRNGDGVVFLDADLQKIDGTNVSQIVDTQTGQVIPSAMSGDEIELDTPIPNRAQFLYKTYDMELNRRLTSEIRQQRRRNIIFARLWAQCGNPLKLELSAQILGKTFTSVAESDAPLATAEKMQTTRDTLLDALDRFGETPFVLNRMENGAESGTRIEFDANVFVPRSVLNQVRQKAVEALQTQILIGTRRATVKIADVATSAETVQNMPKNKVENPQERDTTKPIISVAVMTEAQAVACREMGIAKVYHLRPPVHFSDMGACENIAGAVSLAGSLFDAVTLSETGRTFALDWTFHVANLRTIHFLHRAFPRAETLFLSPEISEKTVRKLVTKTYAHPKFPRFGLVIYGFLYGMYTRKTLFSEPVVLLENQDGRPIFVRKNATVSEPTGSRVYYGNRMDISAQLASSPVPGIAEYRLDFTLETPDEVRKIVRNILTRGWNLPESFSYGYEKGIF